MEENIQIPNVRRSRQEKLTYKILTALTNPEVKTRDQIIDAISTETGIDAHIVKLRVSLVISHLNTYSKYSFDKANLVATKRI